MNPSNQKTAFARGLFGALIGGLLVAPSRAEPAKVSAARAPGGGIQPQAAVDAQGVVHLIYFKGKSQGGDILYVRREPGKETFSAPIRVNRLDSSAIATGTIRGAHLAVGGKGRVHVAWMGGEGAARVRLNGREVTPMLYTRMDDSGTAFEVERNLITWAAGLDGGGSVAADSAGNVYVVWHARSPGDEEGEAARAVYAAHSSDEGRTFQREERANPQPTGACGCCGMRSFADSKGRLYILYRAANQISRDMTLLISRDHAASFELQTVNQWRIQGCPMSSCAFAESRFGVLAVTERDGQIYLHRIDPLTLDLSQTSCPPGGDKRRHPVVAANSKGEVLLAWTEGTAWEKGGALLWQLFDKSGKATAEKGRAEDVPIWSLPTAFASADGNFAILY